ncbi:unnamed protein product [Prorocentrum cordatum]|uniref:Uncharacterized protein n=1 Tax=Prorocentrum cordatum TaxID=2364126 RepID=A0ABN9SMK7_9DINO|nr:unnamed protein product [Polarella glacialis]
MRGADQGGAVSTHLMGTSVERQVGWSADARRAKRIRRQQFAREVQCARHLCERLEKWVIGRDEAGFLAQASREAAALARASLGGRLLRTIGAVYERCAERYFEGLRGSAMDAQLASWQDSGHSLGVKLQAMTSVARSAFAMRSMHEHCAATGSQDDNPVVSIRVWTSSTVDQIAFKYKDGSVRTWGRLESPRGAEPAPFDLANGEYLVQVSARVGDSTDGIQFTTSRGKSSIWYGDSSAGSDCTWTAQSGFHIRGFQSREEEASRPVPSITDVEEIQIKADNPVVSVRVQSTGSEVDQIVFGYKDGSTRAWGEAGAQGAAEHAATFDLAPGEHLAHVEVRVGDSTQGVQFTTSRGRKSAWYGHDAGSPCAWTARSGHHIHGLKTLAGASKPVAGITEIEEKQIQADPEAARQSCLEESLPVFLQAIWDISALDIESTTRSVCEKVLKDCSVPWQLRHRRAVALLRLGRLLRDAGQVDRKDLSDSKEVKQHLEEALLGAMRDRG